MAKGTTRVRLVLSDGGGFHNEEVEIPSANGHASARGVAAIYAALHHFGYPNNKIPEGKQSTFSYVFNTAYDGLYIELSDFKAFITVHLVYTDVAGEEMAQKHRDEMRRAGEDLIETLKQPVDHFGTLFDPMNPTFTE